MKVTNGIAAWSALTKEKWLLQDVVHLLAASIHIQSYVFLKRGFAIAYIHYLVNCMLVSSLQLATFIWLSSCQAHPTYSCICKILYYIFTVSKNNI